MNPINVRMLGQAAEDTQLPEIKQKSGKNIAIIGAGAGGISVAWHLTLQGHEVVIFDESDNIGGKISSVIPSSRIPQETLEKELKRVKEFISDIKLGQKVTSNKFQELKRKFDYTVIAAGAKKPRMLPVPGIELAQSANDFLEEAKTDSTTPGKKVVIVGAGNVGCDVATEAHRLGAENIVMIDVQKPAAFGKEKEDAQAVGATFNWPCFTKEITSSGVILNDNELLEADKVIISIGDVPDLDFLAGTINTKKGFIAVDKYNRTSDPFVFAIGDVVKPGLLTDAIGSGKKVAENIDRLIKGKDIELEDLRPEIEKSRITLEYFDPSVKNYNSLNECGKECASCGRCRDCSICVYVCPEDAIERFETSDQDFEYRADPDKCIGCGFCEGACPCGIWNLVPNSVQI